MFKPEDINDSENEEESTDSMKVEMKRKTEHKILP
jgi:hypothetical protein